MFSSLRGGAGSFAKGLTSDFAALKNGLGAVFTPVTIGVAAAAGVIYLAWENWDKLCKGWSEGCAVMKKAWDEIRIGDAIMSALTLPLTAAVTLVGSLAEKIDALMNKFGVDTKISQGEIEYMQSPDFWSAGGGTIGQNALGGFISRPTVSWIGEDGPEYIIPVGSAYRERGKNLLGRAASALGLTVSEEGGLGAQPPVKGAGPAALPGFGAGGPGWLDGLRSLVPTPQPQMAMAGAGGFSCSVTINAAPGMDERALADEVIRRIEELEARRRRGAYGDDAFFG
jgi:hypothetical protein